MINDEARKFNFYIVNIKFRERLDSTAEQYKELINKIFGVQNLCLSLGGKHYAILAKGVNQWKTIDRSLFTTEVEYFKTQFTKYFDPDSFINPETVEEVSQEDIENNNLKPVSGHLYILFYPEIHRLLIHGIKKSEIKKYLHELFKEHLRDITFNIEFSFGAINEILESSKILSLSVKITTSNSDPLSGIEKEIDDILRDANVDESHMSYKPKKGTTLRMINYIKGLLGLASKNGAAKATVMDGQSKKIINTDDHFEKIKVESLEEKIGDAAFNQLKPRFNHDETAGE